MAVVDVGTFRDKITKLKDGLIAGKPKDDDGYYVVSSSELKECFLQLLRAYNQILKNNAEDFFREYDNVDNIFLFENLSTDFDGERTFNEVVNQYIRNDKSWFQVIRVIPSVVFRDCKIGRFSIGGTTNLLNLFSAIYLEKCLIKDARLDSLFFHLTVGILFCAKGTEFENLHFREVRDGSYNASFYFLDCRFPYTLSIEGNCSFRKTMRFKDCYFGLKNNKNESSIISFNNAKFQNTTEFIGCKFYVSPKFHNTKLHSDTTFHLSKFYDLKSDSAMGDYRALKQLTHDLGSEHDSMMFHALEMDSRRNTVLPPVWKIWHPEWHAKFSSCFLKLANDYGRNFWLPWVWLIGSFCFFSLVYWYQQGVGCNYYKYEDVDLWLRGYCDFNRYADYLPNAIYSFQRALGPLGLIFDSGFLSPKTTGIKLLSLFQFIFSSVLWFIIIVQIRRQFRL